MFNVREVNITSMIDFSNYLKHSSNLRSSDYRCLDKSFPDPL